MTKKQTPFSLTANINNQLLDDDHRYNRHTYADEYYIRGPISVHSCNSWLNPLKGYLTTWQTAPQPNTKAITQIVKQQTVNP